MKTSDLSTAKRYLASVYPEALTPDAVRDRLWAGIHGHITAATLARKFRDAANSGELRRSYYRNEHGEDIAVYAWHVEVDTVLAGAGR